MSDEKRGPEEAQTCEIAGCSEPRVRFMTICIAHRAELRPDLVPKPTKRKPKVTTLRGARHGNEAPGHPDGCRCYPDCDPSR